MKRKKNGAEKVCDHYGVRPLARKLGVAPSTVVRWKQRGQIPQRHLAQLIEDSEGAVTYEDYFNE